MGIPTTLDEPVESWNLPPETSQYAKNDKGHLKKKSIAL